MNDTTNFVFSTLMGGLGNRLFQFATCYSYAKKYNKIPVISKVSEHNQDNPHSKIDYLATIFKNIQQVYPEKYSKFLEPDHKCISYIDLPYISGNVHLWGYFQCEKYFQSYINELKDLFILPELQISPTTNSMFLHVRRGDYTQIKIHGGYNYDIYYKHALDYISNKYDHLNIYIFSNDIEWCKEWCLLKKYEQFSFHYLDLDELETLKFMTLCDQGGICANSSFSWWGAYLNDFKEKTIIVPDQWFFQRPHSNYPNDIAFSGCIKLKVF
jgi:hypothetical protein